MTLGVSVSHDSESICRIPRTFNRGSLMEFSCQSFDDFHLLLWHIVLFLTYFVVPLKYLYFRNRPEIFWLVLCSLEACTNGMLWVKEVLGLMRVCSWRLSAGWCHTVVSCIYVVCKRFCLLLTAVNLLLALSWMSARLCGPWQQTCAVSSCLTILYLILWCCSQIS